MTLHGFELVVIKDDIIFLVTKLSYSQFGDDYNTKDPIKISAQVAAKETAKNLQKSGFPEVSLTRGESAFVWKQGEYHMASVIEGLGTKNLIADEMRLITGKTYYDAIAYDTVATVINDLISVGARPLVMHAYWAIENNEWLADTERMNDLIIGWKTACNQANVTWGGGETPTLKGLIVSGKAEFGGSAVGIIESKQRLITEDKLEENDCILLLKSTGINANGISLARAVAGTLIGGYGTKMNNGMLYGEALLVKSNIYATLLNDLFDNGINIHYLSNITGHGMRKVMRSNQHFTYVIKEIFEPQEVFLFIQKHAGLNEKEMYETYNMGMDYAIFLSKTQVSKAKKLINRNGLECVNAGYIKSGKRQIIIEPKKIILTGESLEVKS